MHFLPHLDLRRVMHVELRLYLLEGIWSTGVLASTVHCLWRCFSDSAMTYILLQAWFLSACRTLGTVVVMAKWRGEEPGSPLACRICYFSFFPFTSILLALYYTASLAKLQPSQDGCCVFPPPQLLLGVPLVLNALLPLCAFTTASPRTQEVTSTLAASSMSPLPVLLGAQQEQGKLRLRQLVKHSSLATDTDVEEGNTCAVCISEFQAGESLSELICGHRFHTDCIGKWILADNGCPLRCSSPFAGGQESSSRDAIAESTSVAASPRSSTATPTLAELQQFADRI